MINGFTGGRSPGGVAALVQPPKLKKQRDMLTWAQNAGNPISEDPNFETFRGRCPQSPLRGKSSAGPMTLSQTLFSKILYPPQFCFVLLPCTSFFQDGPGTNIVRRLSKLTENYTQHHHVELQGERAKVRKVRFTHHHHLYLKRR